MDADTHSGENTEPGCDHSVSVCGVFFPLFIFITSSHTLLYHISNKNSLQNTINWKLFADFLLHLILIKWVKTEQQGAK